jgi:hypothetical protein
LQLSARTRMLGGIGMKTWKGDYAKNAKQSQRFQLPTAR